MADPAQQAPLPDALCRYAILDTEPELVLDDLARLAAYLCGTPIAMVSLVDEGRQWLKARAGIDAVDAMHSMSFAACVIRQDGLFVVPDAAADERFAANPLVRRDNGVRFFAGVPLITPDGHVLGALCVIGRSPRVLTPTQTDAIEILSRQVIAQLELRNSVGVARRAEAALRASEVRHTALLEIMRGAVFTVDRDGIVLEFKASAERSLGYSRQETLGRPLTDFLVPPSQHVGRFPQTTHELIASWGRPPGCRIEVVAIRQDGSTFRAELAVVGSNEEGPLAFTAYLRDLTEQKRAEEALRVSEERFALAVRGIDDGLWDWDVRAGSVYYAARFAELLGYDVHEFGRTLEAWKSRLHPEDHGRVMAAVGEHFERQTRYDVEYRLRSKEGEYRWFRSRGQALWDEDGRPVRMAGSISDITELRRAEAELKQAREDLEARVNSRTAELREQAGALRRAEEGYRGIFENATEGIFQTTPDGHYLRANPSLARIYGFESPEELAAELFDIGRQLYVEHGRREEFRRLVAEQGTVSGFESRVRRKDGGIIWIRESARAVRGPDGELQHYEGLVEDITDRKRAEDEIRALHTELEMAYDATIEGWARALDLRDKETEGHSRRVTEMSLRLARVLGLGGEELVHVRRGALLHDIGKLGVPDSVLLKPGKLTEAEWEVMRRHPTYAHDWLSTIPVLRPAMAIPYGHHERWDGTGYPQGLSGEAIPLAARLFAAVDIWDALRSDRPYRRAWPEAKVRDHLRSLSGIHLDPVVVEAFLQVLEGGSNSDIGETPSVASTPFTGPLAVAGLHPSRSGWQASRLRVVTGRLRDLERVNARLAELAATDELTGLWNRRRFRQALEAACADSAHNGISLSLILMDLDGFKAYNDTHGHPAGDEVLRAVAEVLRAHVRPDDVAARHGGEEFAVLMPETDAEGVVICAERLREAIACWRWPLSPVTASFGTATLPPGSTAAVDLVEQADRALYRAKQIGRNRVVQHENAPGLVAGLLFSHAS